jgi:hypothetical protein
VERDPTRVCELLVGLLDVLVLGVDDLDDGPLVVHVEQTVAFHTCWTNSESRDHPDSDTRRRARREVTYRRPSLSRGVNLLRKRRPHGAATRPLELNRPACWRLCPARGSAESADWIHAGCRVPNVDSALGMLTPVEFETRHHSSVGGREARLTCGSRCRSKPSTYRRVRRHGGASPLRIACVAKGCPRVAGAARYQIEECL